MTSELENVRLGAAVSPITDKFGEINNEGLWCFYCVTFGSKLWSTYFGIEGVKNVPTLILLNKKMKAHHFECLYKHFIMLSHHINFIYT